jgi:hypothetical protein
VPSVGSAGALVWVSWDADAPPDHDPLPRLLAEMETIAERLRSQPGYQPPTEAQAAETRRELDEVVERMRAEREALRAFTAHVKAELARGVPLGEITDHVRPA